MAVYTITYKAKCEGGGHYTFDIKRGTTVVKQITIGPEELQATTVDPAEMALMLMKVAIRTAKPTTMAEARTAIENISVTI